MPAAPQTLLDAEQLASLADWLRGVGVRVSIHQCLLAQQLLVRLSDSGQLPESPEQLPSLLAPIFCVNAEHQRRFPSVFVEWWQGTVGTPISTLIEVDEKPSEPTTVSVKHRRWHLGWVLAFVLGTAVLVGGWWAWENWNQPTKPNPGNFAVPPTKPAIPTPLPLQPDPGAIPNGVPNEAPQDTTIQVWGILPYVGLALLALFPCALYFFRRRHAPVLERMGAEPPKNLREVHVAGGLQGLIPHLGVRELARDLRRRRSITSRDLDIPASLAATLRCGGFARPVFASRIEPEYLLLIDRASLQDHQAALAGSFAESLEAANVSLQRWYFDHEPVRCRRSSLTTAGTVSEVLDLEQLALRYPEHRVVMFSDGSAFFNSYTGELKPWVESLKRWQEPVVFTLESPERWGPCEAAILRQGITLLPLTRLGVIQLSGIFGAYSTDQETEKHGMDSSRELQTVSQRWIERDPPEKDKIDLLCDELHTHLGSHGFQWLAACAVYPEVHWGLTLRLGCMLVPDARELERLLPQISRLLWMRKAFIPDWLRAALLTRMDPALAVQVREALQKMLGAASLHPKEGIALTIAVDQPPVHSTSFMRRLGPQFMSWLSARSPHQLFRRSVKTAAPESPVRDYVFLRFMSGKSMAPLGVDATPLLARVMAQPAAASQSTRVPARRSRTRPVIFISAVSAELHSARNLVARTLMALGYEPKWQDIAPNENGDLRGVLRKWLDDSDAVVQIVGHCYGPSPKEPDPDLGTCSYTQYEALYARQQGKPVYYLFTDKAHPTDGCACEPKTLHELQEKYRKTVKGYGALYHSASSLTQTELLVRRMKDGLEELRAEGQKQQRLRRKWIAIVIGLLLVLILGLGWHTHYLQKTKLIAEVAKILKESTQTDQKVDSVLQRNKQMEQALIKLADAEMHARKSGEKLTSDQLRQRAYTLLENELGITKGTLAKELPGFALELYNRPDTTLLLRARAAYDLNKFDEAEKLLLESEAQDKKLMETAGEKAAELLGKRVDALRNAGKSAEAQFHYTQAMEHYRAAAALTSKELAVLQWLDLQNDISRLYHLQGLYKECLAQTQQVWKDAQQAGHDDAPAVLTAHLLYAIALNDSGQANVAEEEFRAVIQVQERVLGAQASATLTSRDNLALALSNQGKYVEAEQEYRAVLKDRERVLGAEHPDTLASRNRLANVLQYQDKPVEAEQEYRAVLKIQERVLDAKHPDILANRMNIANALSSQGKYVEAEQEYRAVLKDQESVLGAEHPHTLRTRMNLAIVLDAQGKHSEAEQEFRAALQLQERVLGSEYPDTLSSRAGLAIALFSQAKYAEAEQEQRAVLKAQERTQGTEHLSVARSGYSLALILEAQMKLPEALALMQRTEQLYTKLLGTDHPDTKNAITARERIEAALKQPKAK